MRRVYFDNHVYDPLIEAGNKSIRERLRDAVRTGNYVVYGSVVNLEELGGLAGKDTSKYQKLIECFWECVGANVLLCHKWLLEAEFQKSAA
jgi:hypothetical protein